MLNSTKTKRINPKDYQLYTVQNNTANQLDAVSQVPILNGNLVQSVAVTASTPFSVPHGLGQTWQGYWVTQSQGHSCILRTATTTDIAALPDQTIYLTAVPSATATIDIWVF